MSEGEIVSTSERERVSTCEGEIVSTSERGDSVYF